MMRGKSYLGMGGVSMGIAGSIVDPAFFESYLGMRVEIGGHDANLSGASSAAFSTRPNSKRPSRG